MTKPEVTEYGAFYAGYIGLVPDGDYIDLLKDQLARYHDLIDNLDPKLVDFAYAPGKWTVGQVLNHLNDTERIFVYRALAVSRGEKNEIPGYDHNAYVDSVPMNGRSIKDLSDEYRAIRQASIAFYQGLPERLESIVGTVNGNPMSVRALAYMTYGHLQHHLNILKERYFV